MNETILISTAVAIIASAITAYITTRIKMHFETKKWQREFTLTYAETQANNPQHAKSIATQFAIGVLIMEGEHLSERERIFLPPFCRIIAGRGERNEINTKDKLISRRHTAFYTDRLNVYVEDLGSTNGTFINNVSIFERTLLHENDEVTLGNTKITFKKI